MLVAFLFLVTFLVLLIQGIYFCFHGNILIAINCFMGLTCVISGIISFSNTDNTFDYLNILIKKSENIIGHNNISHISSDNQKYIIWFTNKASLLIFETKIEYSYWYLDKLSPMQEKELIKLFYN